MTPSPRRRASLVGVLVAAVLLLPWLTPGGSTEAPTAGAADLSPVERYGACLSGQQEGDLLLVFDKSESLVDNDPHATRVDAATYLLQRLTEFSQSSGAAIDVAVAGFDQDFRATTPWTSLTPESLPTVTGDVAAYAERNDGRDTDYWWALEGSRRLLAEHADQAGQGGDRCQAIFWFSDGELDLDRPKSDEELDSYAAEKPYAEGIDPRSDDVVTADDRTNAAEVAAQQAICSDGGLADQLRASGVVTFGIGLTAGGTDPGEFDLMQSIATGQPMSSGQACGTITSPTPGQFQLATDIEGLLRAIDAFIPGDLRPIWPGKDSTVLNAGQVEPLTFGVVDQDDPVDPADVPGSLLLTAVLVDSEGHELVTAAAQDKSQIGQPLDVDLTDVPSGPAQLQLTLEVTSPSGTARKPQTASYPVTVAPPVGYPRVEDRLTFPRIEGVPDDEAPLTVTGPGCVWFPNMGGAAFAGRPEEAGELTLSTTAATSRGECLELADGQSEQVQIHLTGEHAANGTLNGTFEVGIAPLAASGASDEPRTVEVRFTADLRKPVDEGTRWLVFVVAMLLGLGIPLGTAYGAKYTTAKIPPLPLHARRIPVTVQSDQLLRDGRPFALRDEDLVSLVPLPAGGGRRVVADGVDLRVSTGLSPFGSARVVVSAPGRVAATAGTGTAKDDGTAALPVAVHNSWVLLHDPSGPRDAAEVLLLVGSSTSTAQREELVAQARAQVPRALDRLRAATRPPDDGASAGTFAAASTSGGPTSRRSPFDTDEPAAGAGPSRSPFDFPDGSGGST